jgi:hypothetical protein
MRALCVALVIACGPPPPADEPQPAAEIPSFDDRPVYDVSTAEAPPVVADAWAAVRALRDQPPPDRDTARIAWMRDRAHAIAELEDDLEPLHSGDARDRLFAAVVLATLTYDLYEATREMPTDVEDPEVRAAFEEIVLTFALAARAQYMRCAAVDDPPDSVGAWRASCAERAQTLEVLVPVDPTVLLCAAEEEYPLREAPARDESAPVELAVIAGDDRFTGRSRDSLVTAVHRRLDALHEETLIPLAEVRAAERLAAERRWATDAPVCAEGPSLAAILAQTHPNLMLVYVETQCSEETSDCHLFVWGRYVNDEAMQLHDVAEVTGNPRSIASWTRAAGRLNADPTPAGRGSGRAGQPDLPAGVVLRVRDTLDDDPLLRIGPTVRWRGQAGLAACAPAEGSVGVYSVELALAPTGAVETAAITVDHSPRGADPNAVAACIEQAIRAESFPCPRPGQTNRAQFRVCLGREQ